MSSYLASDETYLKAYEKMVSAEEGFYMQLDDSKRMRKWSGILILCTAALLMIIQPEYDHRAQEGVLMLLLIVAYLGSLLFFKPDDFSRKQYEQATCEFNKVKFARMALECYGIDCNSSPLPEAKHFKNRNRPWSNPEYAARQEKNEMIKYRRDTPKL